MSSHLVHAMDNNHPSERVNCTVQFLDGDSKTFDINANDVGQALYNSVCNHFKVTETDYFGLKYTVLLSPEKKLSNVFECVPLSQHKKPNAITEHKFWLQLNKPMSSQIKRGNWKFEFALKFYPPDPTKLTETFTRSLVVLQIRTDLLDGRLPCSFGMLALLESYCVQAELGDYVRESRSKYEHNNIFLAKHEPKLLDQIAEFHKEHKGQTHHEAQMAFLDNVKKLALYGVDLHKARDLHKVPVNIGVNCNGITVYKDNFRIHRFVWPKILRFVYKQKHFCIKIRPKEKENPTWQNWKLDHFKLAKNLWRICSDQHTYFRYFSFL
ncbi:band 4.1-like protein 3 [Physella acuta]|uniref:band 4.1-like protein 3 n=1 Tax=Physella acuta TaxID=109671 RepID=UPI0027DE6CCC|nr:band 4.1-like protein 3 [Physella acuta]